MPKCKNCGLLSIRTISGINREANPSCRKTGETASDCTPYPHCTVGIHELETEHGSSHDGSRNESVTFLRVIELERLCDGFLSYRPNFNPKEHLEMHYQEVLRKEAKDLRDWQESRLKEDKNRAEQLAKDMKEEERKWQVEQKQADRAWQQRQTWEQRFFQIVLAAFLGVSGWMLTRIVDRALKASPPTEEKQSREPERKQEPTVIHEKQATEPVRNISPSSR